MVKASRQMRLMIVDDHAETRGLIRELIGHLAAEIVECVNGEEAVAGCERFRPDFVTMDLNMEPTDGLEATRRVLALHPHTCVVVVTQSYSTGVLEAASRAGARYFIAKDDLALLPQYVQLHYNPGPA